MKFEPKRLAHNRYHDNPLVGSGRISLKVSTTAQLHKRWDAPCTLSHPSHVFLGIPLTLQKNLKKMETKEHDLSKYLLKTGVCSIPWNGRNCHLTKQKASFHAFLRIWTYGSSATLHQVCSFDDIISHPWLLFLCWESQAKQDVKVAIFLHVNEHLII